MFNAALSCDEATGVAQTLNKIFYYFSASLTPYFMKISFYVIDDVRADIDRLVREAEKTRELVFEGSYASAHEALADFREKQMEPTPVIFCDIRLREENGLDAGPELAKYCKYLVFVTGLAGQKEKVLDAMGDDHLQKPVTSDQIRVRVLNRFFRRHGDEIPLRIHLNRLFITVDKVEYAVKLKDILFVKHHQNYLDIMTKNERKYTTRGTIAHAFSLLEPAGIFVQVNNGAIINMKYLGLWNDTEAWIGEHHFALKGKGREAFQEYRKRNRLGNGGATGKSE